MKNIAAVEANADRQTVGRASFAGHGQRPRASPTRRPRPGGARSASRALSGSSQLRRWRSQSVLGPPTAGGPSTHRAAAKLAKPAGSGVACTFAGVIGGCELAESKQRVEEAVGVPARGARVSLDPTAGVSNDAPASRGDPYRRRCPASSQSVLQDDGVGNATNRYADHARKSRESQSRAYARRAPGGRPQAYLLVRRREAEQAQRRRRVALRFPRG